MEALMQLTVVGALLGSALIGGVFFTFSNFVMPALARRPAPEGMAAMQAVNETVLNPGFLGVFMGTAVLSLVLIAAVSTGSAGERAPWLLAGALAYLVGTFAVTAAGNVPLNKELARMHTGNDAAAALWRRYLAGWTRLNTLRTAAALVAAACLLVALLG